jgi:outer membrane immunogenic protein
MKRLYGLSAFLALAMSFAAHAANLKVPVKAPPPPPEPVATWTGFYVGGGAGVSVNDSSSFLSPSGCFTVPTVLCGGALTNNPLRSDSARFSDTSFTANLQAGFNWQASMWVLGLEGDINYNGASETDRVNRPLAAPLVGNFVHSTSERLDWFSTVRARAGFLPTPALLLYGTGGLAFGHVASVTSVAFTSTTDTYAGSINTTRAGWTAGAGAEWMFAPGWSAKIEYLFVDLGRFSYTNTCITAVCTGFTPAPAYQTDLRIHDNIVRVGFNYHFAGSIFGKQ